jgi:hypothetical protein
MGTNAADRAPSAKRSRVRFGIRKLVRNASFWKPAPKRSAITISRTSPVMRLRKIDAETIPAERTTFSDFVGLSAEVASNYRPYCSKK